MNLPPWSEHWWAKANDRRQRLIAKKHRGGGLTPLQERELEMLQKVADAVLDYVSDQPSGLGSIDA